jgi:ectoine hydroxylase-related dioxygenase (phytanoyl-CoA dioxygenase family)
VALESWQRGWDKDGYFIQRQLVDPPVREAMLARAWELVRASATARESPIVIRYERELPPSLRPEERVSKLYRLHRVEQAFQAVFESPLVTETLRALIGPDVDLFLSQVVFKVAGALGQPWHQDAAIFPFEPAGPILGVWCALTDARHPSSRLGLQPGSHIVGQRRHSLDATQPTGGRYLSIADEELGGGGVVDVAAGDGVLFDSQLVHCSTDNQSDTTRVAVTAHFAAAGTIDHTSERFGASPYNDWMPWLREGRSVAA